MNNYYFISYAFFKKPGILDKGKPGFGGESCECINVHPFDFLEKKVGEGFIVTIKFFTKITEDEYNKFMEVVQGASQ